MLLPTLFLNIGATVIGKRQDLVVASVFFLTTALIHMVATNLLFSAEYGMQKSLIGIDAKYLFIASAKQREMGERLDHYQHFAHDTIGRY